MNAQLPVLAIDVSRDLPALQKSVFEFKQEDAKIRNFFNTMSEGTRESCLTTSKMLSFSAGEIIFEQDTIGSSMYFIDSGRATITVNGRTVGNVGEGEFIGEGSFMATIRSLLIEGTVVEIRSHILAMFGLANVDSFHVMRAATLTASTHCRCLELNVKDFLAAFEGDWNGLGAALG
jgi:CRP-like cAMP-binding protein